MNVVCSENKWEKTSRIKLGETQKKIGLFVFRRRRLYWQKRRQSMKIEKLTVWAMGVTAAIDANDPETPPHLRVWFITKLPLVNSNEQEKKRKC